jgi:aryl-alcohol dehydrogenase-like predicted oxidoreductase
MEYARIGSSGLWVSRIGLGMMSYGDPAAVPWYLDEEAAEPIVRRAVEAGVTFFDTADMYSAGISEEITGRLLAKLFGARDDYVLATKVYYPTGDGPNDRGLSRKHIIAAVDASLRRLGTDHIDLYQVHRWDDTTPIEETMAALHDLVRAGKVRYLGASLMRAWQFAVAQAAGPGRFVSMQTRYNLVYREEEREMLPLCAYQGVGVLPYSPLARGLLARGPVASSAALGPAASGSAISDAEAPGPADHGVEGSGPAISDPAAPGRADYGGAISDPTASDPAASDPAASDPAATGPAGSATSRPAASRPAATGPAGSATSRPAASRPAATGPAGSATSRPAGSAASGTARSGPARPAASARPVTARAASEGGRRRTDDDAPVVDALWRVAAARGVPPARIALAWLLSRPGVTAPIVGATKARHLDDAVAAVDLRLTTEEVAALEEHYRPHEPYGSN